MSSQARKCSSTQQWKQAPSLSCLMQCLLGTVPGNSSLKQKVSKFLRLFPPFSACFYVRILQMRLLTHNPALNLLSFLSLLLSPRCQMVSINKRLFKQRILLNTTGSTGKLYRLSIIPKGQGRRSIYKDRVDQSPCTVQTKINCLQIVVAKWEAQWYLPTPKTSQCQVKTQICYSFVKIWESSQKEETNNQ